MASTGSHQTYHSIQVHVEVHNICKVQLELQTQKGEADGLDYTIIIRG
jgi:hypothetical protein